MNIERGSTESLSKLPDLRKKPDDTYRKLCDALAKSEIDGSVINVVMDHVELTKNIRGEVLRDADFAALKLSIQERGLFHPVIIQLIDNRPTLVAGYRRWAACQEIGMTKIKATAKAPETEWRVVQIFENILRSNIPGIKFAEAMKELKALYPDDTHTELARRIGLSDRGAIGFYLKAADWPQELKDEALAKGLSKRGILQIARQRESNEPKALEAMIQNSPAQDEKKEAPKKETPIDSKTMNEVCESSIKQTLILAGVTSRDKTVMKLAQKCAALQPELRRKLAKALLELDEPF